MHDRRAAEETLRWLKESGVQKELIDFAYVFVRSALNRILLTLPGHEIYGDPRNIRQNLLGQASAIAVLAEIRGPEHRPRDWPEATVAEVAARTVVIYAQLLRFTAGMIDEQDEPRRTILMAFKHTIMVLAEEDHVELGRNPA